MTADTARPQAAAAFLPHQHRLGEPAGARAVPARRRLGPSPRRGRPRSRPASGRRTAAPRARSSGGRRAAARGSASTPTSSPRTTAAAAGGGRQRDRAEPRRAAPALSPRRRPPPRSPSRSRRPPCCPRLRDAAPPPIPAALCWETPGSGQRREATQTGCLVAPPPSQWLPAGRSSLDSASPPRPQPPSPPPPKPELQPTQNRPVSRETSRPGCVGLFGCLFFFPRNHHTRDGRWLPRNLYSAFGREHGGCPRRSPSNGSARTDPPGPERRHPPVITDGAGRRGFVQPAPGGDAGPRLSLHMPLDCYSRLLYLNY